MLHKLRRFCLKPATLESIQADFEHTDDWCECMSYKVEHDGTTYLLLNDTFEGGGGAEMAICKVLSQRRDLYTVQQQESLTMSWVPTEKLPEAIIECFNSPVWVSAAIVVCCDDWQEHRCGLCA